MLLRNVIAEVGGLRYLVEKLDLQSVLGKRYLLDTSFHTDSTQIETELSLVENVFTLLKQTSTADAIAKIQVKLMQIRDINGTINNILNNRILDEIELFELKSFILLEDEIRNILNSKSISIIDFPDLTQEIDKLDPEAKRIPSFYIYDAYSEELARLRKEIKQKKQELTINLKESGQTDKTLEDQIEQLRSQAQEIEDRIREELSNVMFERREDLKLALDQVAHLDILIAKALQAKSYGFTKPVISKQNTNYNSLFNPQLKDLLNEEGRKYQAIDIMLDNSACMITGANMAGKTVVLKTLALSQYLVQFGFFIPAEYAKIKLVEGIMISMGDEQNELNGLSSYASEMMKIHQMIEAVKSGKNLLILIDELARTTNPYEGRAIVSAVAEILNENQVQSVITTHYSGLNTSCRKLRVKGFIEEKARGNVNKNNINDYIDYSLVEDISGSVPQEALRIASILGVDNEIIERAGKVMENL